MVVRRHCYPKCSELKSDSVFFRCCSMCSITTLPFPQGPAICSGDHFTIFAGDTSLDIPPLHCKISLQRTTRWLICSCVSAGGTFPFFSVTTTHTIIIDLSAPDVRHLPREREVEWQQAVHLQGPAVASPFSKACASSLYKRAGINFIMFYYLIRKYPLHRQTDFPVRFHCWGAKDAPSQKLVQWRVKLMMFTGGCKQRKMAFPACNKPNMVVHNPAVSDVAIRRNRRVGVALVHWLDCIALFLPVWIRRPFHVTPCIASLFAGGSVGRLRRYATAFSYMLELF